MTAPQTVVGNDAEISWPVHIGQAAQLSGVSAKMVRHYESLGLLHGLTRSDGGYRLYNATDVHTLRFIKRARDMGFSMKDLHELVNLWQDQTRASLQVKQIADRHIQTLRLRIEQLQAMERSLRHLTHCCHGDQRPDCPILDDLAGPPP